MFRKDGFGGPGHPQAGRDLISCTLFSKAPTLFLGPVWSIEAAGVALFLRRGDKRRLPENLWISDL